MHHRGQLMVVGRLLGIATLLGLVFPLLLAMPVRSQELVRKCLKDDCASAVVDDGNVMFHETSGYITSPRSFGNYIPPDQSYVPPTEAPIRDIRTGAGWRVIATAALDDYSMDCPTIRVRIIDQAGKTVRTFDGDNVLDRFLLAKPFDSSDEVVVVQL